MHRRGFVALLLALPLSLLAGACAAPGASGPLDSDVTRFFSATWRAFATESSGNVVYGNVNGKESLLDVVLAEDGSCTVTPLEDHEDLLASEGTWEASDTTAVTLHLPEGDIELSVIDDITLKGPASPFGVGDFETLTFEYL